MKRLFPLFLIFTFIVIDQLPAQFISKREFIQLESDAKWNYQNLNFHDALPLYLKLDSIKPDVPKYRFPIGVSYLYFNDAKRSIPYLESCLDKKEITSASLHYYLAKAYHLNTQFEKAIEYYTLYKAFFAGKKAKHYKKLYEDIDQQIVYCTNGKDLYNNPVNVRVTNLGPFINSIYPEYAPVLSGDEREIIITSSRPDTKGGSRDYSADGHYYEDVYISTRNSQKWEELRNIGDSINTTGHDASVALSFDGKSLLVYRYSDKDILSGGSGDLYISNYKDLKWNQAKKLPFCESNFWESSACMSKDGSVIIYSSNREGGKGGSDLYSVTQNANGEWSIPVSLGDKINTVFDEDSPYLSTDGKTLYFSSKGHTSMGGYDVFVSHLSDESLMWAAPKNIGYPLNTPFDDLHYSWSADGKRIYFASIRPEGFGDRDIYYAEYIVEEKTDTTINILLTASVCDSVTQNTIESTIKIYELDIEGSTTSNVKQLVLSSEFTSMSIELLKGKKYLLIVESEGYKSYTESIDLSTAQDDNLKKLFSMTKEESE